MKLEHQEADNSLVFAKENFCHLPVISQCIRPPLKLSRWVENYPRKERSFLVPGKDFNRMHFETEEVRQKARQKSEMWNNAGLGNAKHFRLGPEGGPKAIRHLRSGLWQCNHLWLNLGRPRSKASTKVMKTGTQFEQAHISKAVEIGIVKNGIKSEFRKTTKLGKESECEKRRRPTF